MNRQPTVRELQAAYRERSRQHIRREAHYHCLLCMDLGYIIERPVHDRPAGRFNRPRPTLCHCQ